MSAQNPALEPSAVYAGAELLIAGLRIIDMRSGQLECTVCRRRWSRSRGAGGRRPRASWRCPNGCNSKSKPAQATDPAG